jgi:hypothetical protein
VSPRLHAHAATQIAVRGATEAEVIDAVETGETAPARYARTQFRKTFSFNGERAGKRYTTKTVEAYAVNENGWLVITVLVKFGGRVR